MRFLLFTLYAPFASFGAVAVGERRMGWSRPGRSALLGIVASALGIERREEDRQLQLERALGFAVRVDAPGIPFTDYHTAQTPQARKRAPAARTRREELAAPTLHTVVSTREWRADSCYTVAAWCRDEPPALLDEVSAALRAPALCPYLGRKAAPLGLPPHPSIHDASSLPEALRQRQRSEVEQDLLRTLERDRRGALVASDMDAPGLPADYRTERRRDALASRARWQFAERVEAVFWLRDADDE